MKKLLTLMMVGFVALTLAACGGNGGTTTKYIELTYADWGNPEFNQRMLDKFMEKYPNIRVTLRQDITGSGAEFTGNLVNAAQAGLLPDVFATDNVPTIVLNGLTLDLADMWDEDADAQMIYDDIATTAVYNGHRYAVPSFQFLKGIFINLDIFENSGLTSQAGKFRLDENGYPVKDWTHSEFVEIAKAITNYDIVNTENLVIGFDTWYGSPDFQQVWPMMNNSSYGYDTWDGTKFNYTDAEWIAAMQAKVEIDNYENNLGVTSRYPEEDWANTPALQTYVIQTGYAAMDIEGSWQFWVLQEAKDNGINMGFWPYPSGSEGLFPPTILDYQAVSAQTKYPEEAFLLAKWMTFGQDGWNARLDLYEEDKAAAELAGETPVYLDRFPMADYPGVWDRVDALVDGIEGIDYTLDRISNARPDLDKWLAGYKTFWAWVSDPENPYRWTELQTAGPTAVPTFAEQWNLKANELVQQEIAALGAE
jgi:multiple sugar transport system substrate-binding protein